MTASPAIRERRDSDWLLVVAILALIGTFVRAIYFTPPEAKQGAAQKIFYVHVPSAFIGLYVAFGIVAVAGGLYLWLRDERLDRIAASAAEVGVVFMTVVLVTGPMWGKPIWGTWWTWDARLTMTLFLWFVVVGYLVLRGAIDDRQTRALLGGARHPLGAARAVHPPERVHVPHAPPAAGHPQAERAVAAGRDADDVAARARRLPAALHGAAAPAVPLHDRARPARAAAGGLTDADPRQRGLLPRRVRRRDRDLRRLCAAPAPATCARAGGAREGGRLSTVSSSAV